MPRSWEPRTKREGRHSCLPRGNARTHWNHGFSRIIFRQPQKEHPPCLFLKAPAGTHGLKSRTMIAAGGASASRSNALGKRNNAPPLLRIIKSRQLLDTSATHQSISEKCKEPLLSYPYSFKKTTNGIFRLPRKEIPIMLI